MTGRRNRKNRRRGVSPIVATILLVAMTVVLAAVLYVLISGLSHNTSAKVPISTALALGIPTRVNQSGQNWYNFSVASAGNGLTWGNLQFQIITPGGAVVHLPGAATVTVLNLGGSAIGTYNYGTAIWGSGASTGVTSQETLSVYSAAIGLLGDHFVVFGTGTFQGSISVLIP